jgi:predicted RNase H-like nuclease (RuvC/YqgF family)
MADAAMSFSLAHRDTSDDEMEQLAQLFGKHMKPMNIGRKKGPQGREIRLVLNKPPERKDGGCPCDHFSSCPYRQRAERLEKLNDGQELRIRAMESDAAVLKDDYEKLKQQIDKQDRRNSDQELALHEALTKANESISSLINANTEKDNRIGILEKENTALKQGYSDLLQRVNILEKKMP